MKRNLVVITLLALFVILFTGSINPTNKVENFSLKDYNGKEFSLKEFKTSKAIVLMFIATECPVSNAYNSRMAKIYESYKDKNVTFLGINSNKAESVSDMKAHAEKNNLKFTILKDDKNLIADKLGASVTPEIYLLNNQFEIVYHGRIDDSRDESSISENNLATALDEVLSNKKVTKSQTKAFGCTIKRI